MSQPIAEPPTRSERFADTNLIWVDMEMSGLNPDSDRVLEIAIVVTDSELNILAEAPVLVVHQDESVLSAMDVWNTATHTRSGLIERVRSSTTSESDVAERMVQFMAEFVARGKSPMCGNTICQDRRFMARWIPQLEAFFHYRNLDVSTLKELARRWRPEIYRSFEKKSRHEALADIYESIEELRHYRTHFLRT